MSLKLKFTVLLAVIGLAVLGALTTAWWSLSVVQREVRRPVESMTTVLAGLGELLDALAARRADLLRRPAGTPRPAGNARDLAQLADRLRELDPWALTQTGKSTFANLRARMARIGELDAADPLVVEAETDAAVELIELIRRRIVENSALAVAYGDEIRRTLFWALAGALIIVALACVLGGLLVRRWVLRPIAELRAATQRIGAGDFSYRIAIAPSRAGKLDELARLSAEVNSMAGLVARLQDERVEQARLAAVGEMVRRLAHNLRNPLSGIRSLAELSRIELSDVASAAPPGSPAPGELAPPIDNQRRIIKAVDRFEGWLSDLLSVSRPVDLSSVAILPVEVGAWLESIAEAHRPGAIARGITLDVDTAQGPRTASIDRRHLDQAVTAIITNALEASPNGCRITIATGLSAPGGAFPGLPGWSLRITDQGPGVPNELRERIFRPYFTTKRDGSGIGLASALQAVELHGGRISVESPPDGTGAVFVIDLPFLHPPVGHTGPPTLDLRPASPATIGHPHNRHGPDSGDR
jgi:signal transduction histidine kinase